jgi:hypothetical protein
MKSLKNALHIIILSTLIVGCGVKKESPDSASGDGDNPEMNQKVSSDVASLNASITQGLNQLKTLNDPNINEIYTAINNLTADSTVDELNNINAMVFNHLEALKSGQVVAPAQIPNQDDTSLAGQLAAQQATGQSKGGIEGLKANLEQLKTLNKAKYDEVNGFIQKVDLHSMSAEEIKQLNNIVAKAVMDERSEN